MRQYHPTHGIQLHPQCDFIMEDGDERIFRENPSHAPDHVGTRRVTFGDMIERDCYHHSSRKVRRNGNSDDTRDGNPQFAAAFRKVFGDSPSSHQLVDPSQLRLVMEAYSEALTK